MLAKLASQAESGGSAASMVEDDGVAHLGEGAGEKGAETACRAGDKGDGLRR
jgi:hypothetical protein